MSQGFGRTSALADTAHCVYSRVAGCAASTKKIGPEGSESRLVDRLGDLPGAFAELERKSCSFCASSGRVSIFATPKGQFLDFDGRILTGSFSVTGESDPRDETVWLSRVIAFNGFTGTIRTFTYKRGAWSSD
jgi:hypothetical protein